MLILAIGLGAALCVFGGVMLFSRLLAVGAAAAVVLVASVLYHRFLSAPECGSDEVTFAVIEELSPKFSNDALTVNNIRTLRGGFLSSHSECEMDVTPMSGGSLGTVQKWTKVTYSTSRSKLSGDVNVKAQIVGDVVVNPAGSHAY
jgi:hypothetical protein